MKTLCTLFLFLIICLHANEEVAVDIKADSFVADKEQNIVIFNGNVSMIKGQDNLHAQKLTVYTKQNEQNETVVRKYIAIGDVDLKMKKPDTLMIAKGDSIIYDVDKQEYLIEGNGYLEDVNKSRIIKGERIYIDRISQKTKIDGKENKPVQFKFTMEEKTNDNN